jgi:hypothetical protein
VAPESAASTRSHGGLQVEIGIWRWEGESTARPAKWDPSGTRLATIIAQAADLELHPDLADGMPRHPPVALGAKLKLRSGSD